MGKISFLNMSYCNSEVEEYFWSATQSVCLPVCEFQCFRFC